MVGAGLGLLSLVHHDLQAAAESLVRHSHLNPARHYPRIFIEAAAHMNDSRLRSLAALAFLYAAVRLIEAYGLWRTRVWAEWFAIIAGSVYLPIEVYEMFRRATWTRGAVLLINLSIVAYLVNVRLSRCGPEEPTASSRTRTATPCAARSASVSRKRVPTSPDQKMYASKFTVFRAEEMAASMAGKTASPFSRSSSRLPDVIVGPGSADGRNVGSLTMKP